MNLLMPMLYLTTLSVAKYIQHRTIQSLLNNVLKEYMMKRSWPNLRQYLGIFPQGLRKIRKNPLESVRLFGFG
jgi:hypothetical protein